MSDERFPAGPISAPLTRDIPDPPNVRIYDQATAGSRNTMRALWAGMGVKAYARETGLLNQEEPVTAIKDLLNDMRHLCDALNLDFEEISANSERSYLEEVSGQDGY